MSAAVTATTRAVAGALRLLHARDEVFEIRVIDGRTVRATGYFDDADSAAVAVEKWDGKANIYHTINLVNPKLLARSPNRLHTPKSGGCTSDHPDDILSRAWLAIDVDPDREADISATDAELHEAMRIIGDTHAYLVDERGWPPAIVTASGNGGHLEWRIEEPNDDETRDLIARLLGELALRFDEPGVAHVDTSLFNASRILKVPGTTACKGTDTEERPHRRSRFIEVPEQAVWLPRSAMEALAGPPPPARKKSFKVANGNGGGAGGGRFQTDDDVKAHLAEWHLEVRNVKTPPSGTTWVLAECPVNSEHDHGEAFVRRAADGVLSAGCQHQSCTWKWAELRAMFEPGYRERRNGDGSKPAKPKPPQKPAAEASDDGVVDDPEETACDAPRTEAPKPTPLGEAAYHGPLGAFVRAWEPHTEADPAALLATVLVGYSSILGPGPRHTVSGDAHAARLWACVVGASSAARKGMSYKPARNLLAKVDPGWDSRCTASGLSTGEGLIHHVRDRVMGTITDKKTGETTEVVEDPGVEDKRLFLLEAEFARVLTVMARKDNTLSAIARGLWDSGEAGVMTRTAPATTHGAHVCLIAHVTMEELRRVLTDCDAANGFANRFLWVYAERHGSLPFGGQADPEDLERVRGHLARAFIHAPDGEIDWSEDARALWVEKYDGLLRAGGGLTGSIIARGQPQVLRLALVYALADDVVEIGRVHLEAALEVWRYCAESARYIFGERTGDNTADRILAELRERGTMTRNDIRELFDRHKSSTAIGAALETLRAAGLAESEKAASEGGRPAEVWRA